MLNGIGGYLLNMEEIKNTLLKRAGELHKPQLSAEKLRPINIQWEEAKEFGSYVGLSTPFVLKLFKQHGKHKVLALRSFLKDSMCDKKFFAGMVVNRLKGKKV